MSSFIENVQRSVVRKPNRHTVGVFMVMLGTFLFSSKSVLIQWLYSLGMGVDQLLLLRMLLSLPLYCGLGYFAVRSMRSQKQSIPTGRQIGGMIFAGILCYHVASYLDMWALQFISAGLERTILFSYPLFVAVIQHFRGEQLNKWQWLSLAVAYLGIYAFYFEDQRLIGLNIAWGALAVLAAAALTAYFTLASQHFSARFPSDLFTAVAMGSTAFSISIHTLLLSSSTEAWVFSVEIMVGLLILATCCTVLAAFLFNRGIAASGAVCGTVGGMVGPLVTVLLSALVLDTQITYQHGIALMIVVCGMLGFQKVSIRQKI